MIKILENFKYFFMYFSNRNIAIFLIFSTFIAFCLYEKDLRKNIKKMLLIISSFKRFILLYFIYYIGISYFLYVNNIINLGLILENIMWVFFSHFIVINNLYDKVNYKKKSFAMTLLEEIISIISITGLFRFIADFTSFNIIVEIIMMIIYFLLYFIKYPNGGQLRGVLKYIIFFQFINSLFFIIFDINSFISLDTLKEYIYQTVMIFLFIPVYYIFFYNIILEEILIRVKYKNIKSIIKKFTKFSIYRLLFIRDSLQYFLEQGPLDMTKINDIFIKLDKKLNMKIGENYMKRMNRTIIMLVFSLAILLGVFIVINPEYRMILVSFNLKKLKFIFNLLIVFSIIIVVVLIPVFFILKRRSTEEIFNVKKFVMNELLLIIKRQKELSYDIKIENSTVLYYQNIYDMLCLYKIINKNISKYDNLLLNYEIDLLNKVLEAIFDIMFVFGFFDLNQKIEVKEFEESYFLNFNNSKKYDIENRISKYIEKINECYEEFKNLI